MGEIRHVGLVVDWLCVALSGLQIHRNRVLDFNILERGFLFQEHPLLLPGLINDRGI